MKASRIVRFTGVTAALVVATFAAAPAASADTTLHGRHGGDCLTITDTAVNYSPTSVTIGKIEFTGVSDCE